jgi:hypothetical protein
MRSFFVVLRILLLISCTISYADSQENQYTKFTNSLVGKDTSEEEYSKQFSQYYSNFKNNFIDPISQFSTKHITSEHKALFYPFAGADISYPLMLFPKVEKFVLIGLEFPGKPDITGKVFNLKKFTPQMEGYFRSGFFKTMNMSAQMLYDQGVIPMLAMQITIFGGQIKNIENIQFPYKGLKIQFIHGGIEKQILYFRANLDDYNHKESFYDFILSENLIANCMLKASSYKLHQPEFKQLRKFMIKECKYLLQDDTGIPINIVESLPGNISFYGKYIKPYGDEFKPYFQKELAYDYQQNKSKESLNFCFGYGCGKVETNIQIWQSE